MEKKETAVVRLLVLPPFHTQRAVCINSCKAENTLDCLVFSTTVIYLVGYELELFFALSYVCVIGTAPPPAPPTQTAGIHHELQRVR